MNCNDNFIGKNYLGSKSTHKIGKYLLIKLLILGKIGLSDNSNLKEAVLKTLLWGFRALPR